MSKIERFLKMAQVGSQLKKFRWEEEDRARAREQEEEFLSGASPELRAAYYLRKKGGFSEEASLDITGYVSPEEKKKRVMIGELAHLKSVSGPGILKHMAERPETPPETKRKMMGLRETFPSIVTGYEKPQLTKEQAGKSLRIKEKLEAEATSRAVTADERAKRYEDIPEDKRTNFQNKFLKKYYGEGKSTQLEKDKEYVRRRLTTIVTSAITERAKQGETISKALAIKTPEVRSVLAELKPIHPDAVEEILKEMGVMEIPPSWGAELDKYNSYDEFYKSLSSEEQSSIEPEEERAMKQYYGTF